MAAAATLSLLPVIALFFFAQRYLVEGFAGAVKS
jgi:raffinose/stachyose/melibiose transport system permease protein